MEYLVGKIMAKKCTITHGPANKTIL